MTASWAPLTTAEALEIERLLLAGYPVLEVQQRTGRSAGMVRAVRSAAGIAPQKAGRRPRSASTVPMEAAEGGYEPSGDPCELLYAERPNQENWLELLRTANPAQLERMRRAVCKVLGLSVFATGETLASAAIADRRTADQLAVAYLQQAGLR